MLFVKISISGSEIIPEHLGPHVGIALVYNMDWYSNAAASYSCWPDSVFHILDVYIICYNTNVFSRWLGHGLVTV